MSVLYNLKNDTYDREAIEALSTRMFKYLMNKYIKGRGRAVIMDNYRVIISPNRCGSTGGLSWSKRRNKYYFRNSINFGGILESYKLKDKRAYNHYIKSFIFGEYSHIRNDDDIGAFECSHPDHIIKGVAAHEVAHVIGMVIEFCCYKKVARYNFPQLKTTFRFTPAIAEIIKDSRDESHTNTAVFGAHSLLWQELYRELRIKYVNNGIK